MGTDAHAVVDTSGYVHAVQGLSVVDASVFPHITNGNLNAPTIMLAERMADLMRGTGCQRLGNTQIGEDQARS